MFTRDDTRQILAALEEVTAQARASFACLFSDSDEYEDALVTARRAQGRYDNNQRPSWLPIGMFIGLTMVVAGAALLLA